VVDRGVAGADGEAGSVVVVVVEAVEGVVDLGDQVRAVGGGPGAGQRGGLFDVVVAGGYGDDELGVDVDAVLLLERMLEGEVGDDLEVLVEVGGCLGLLSRNLPLRTAISRPSR